MWDSFEIARSNVGSKTSNDVDDQDDFQAPFAKAEWSAANKRNTKYHDNVC